MDTEHPWRQLALVLAVTGIAVWSEMPEWQRTHLTMVARARTRRVVAWAARRAGHRGMSHELAGHDEAAAVSYSLAHHLAQLRDRL